MHSPHRKMGCFINEIQLLGQDLTRQTVICSTSPYTIRYLLGFEIRPYVHLGSDWQFHSIS